MKKVFHQFSWNRSRRLWFWKGQILCRIFGHRINNNHMRLACGRCHLAFEEIYNGLDYYEDMRNVFK